MARSRTATPRSSSTSLCPALFSRSQDTWVKARASKEASENEYPNSFSSRACCEFFFRLACVRCERVMALDTGRDNLQWSPPQPSRFKIVDFDFDFTINLISSRKDQDREIVSAESSTQASGSIDLLFNKHGEFPASEAKTKVSLLHSAQLAHSTGPRFLNFTTHVIRQRSRNRATPGRIRKNVKISQRQISEERERAVECSIGFAWEADDDVATQGGIR